MIAHRHEIDDSVVLERIARALERIAESYEKAAENMVTVAANSARQTAIVERNEQRLVDEHARMAARYAEIKAHMGGDDAADLPPVKP
jgi:methyl coenzyme M reductase subunit C-like uncharacterized protein (methanogenesis marker protein 7)